MDSSVVFVVWVVGFSTAFHRDSSQAAFLPFAKICIHILFPTNIHTHTYIYGHTIVKDNLYDMCTICTILCTIYAQLRQKMQVFDNLNQRNIYKA